MQNNELSQWIKNAKSEKPNKEILFFNTTKNYGQYNLDDLMRFEIVNAGVVNMHWINNQYKQMSYHLKNTIFIRSIKDTTGYETIKQYISRGVIYIDEIDTINRVIDMLCSRNIYEDSELKYTLIPKVEFEEIMKFDIKTLKEFILTREFILNQINCSFVLTDSRLLNNCLEAYDYSKILVASFAQHLYRLATLNFISNQKFVGGAIRKTLGVKSKAVNCRVLNPNSNLRWRKNIRVYDLNENQIQTDTQINIAKKLVALDIKGLDVSKIADITELPIKKIEKLYRDCFIR